MKFRKRLSREGSRRQFHKRSGVHLKNVRRSIMRGGVAL